MSGNPEFTTTIVIRIIAIAMIILTLTRDTLLISWKIIKQVGFGGNFKEFLDMLRTDKRFYYATKVSCLVLFLIRFCKKLT